VEVSGQLHTLPALVSKKDLSTNRIGGWVGPRAGIDGFGEEKISYLIPVFEPQTVQTILLLLLLFYFCKDIIT